MASSASTGGKERGREERTEGIREREGGKKVRNKGEGERGREERREGMREKERKGE